MPHAWRIAGQYFYMQEFVGLASTADEQKLEALFNCCTRKEAHVRTLEWPNEPLFWYPIRH